MSLNVYSRMKCTKYENYEILHRFNMFYISREYNRKKDYHMHIKKFFFVLKFLSSRYPK